MKQVPVGGRSHLSDSQLSVLSLTPHCSLPLSGKRDVESQGREGGIHESPEKSGEIRLCGMCVRLIIFEAN